MMTMIMKVMMMQELRGPVGIRVPGSVDVPDDNDDDDDDDSDA